MGKSRNSITADRLDRQIGTSDGPVIVDVRRKDAFDGSDRIIKTARWRDPERVSEWAGELPEGSAVVYCVHGHEVSRNAAAALRSAGIDAAYLEGGIEGFVEAGGQTVPK